MAPLAIDLFCGLGGWTEGLLAEGYYVVGFDIEQHVYGEHRYPGQLVLQDILSLHGSQFKDAALIVGSSPCQEFSYRAMPWKRAKALPPPYLGMELFNAQFRIQREACEAAGRHIPMVVENVKGAQKWVGRARWNFGSFYLWGDVPALMPMAVARKNNGGSWFAVAHNTTSGHSKNARDDLVADLVAAGVKNKDEDGYERNHPAAFGWKKPRTSSRSQARKAATAMIAKIPLALAQHIGRAWKPQELAA